MAQWNGVIWGIVVMCGLARAAWAEATWKQPLFEAPPEAVLAAAQASTVPEVEGVQRLLVDIRLQIAADGRTTIRRREVLRLLGERAVASEGALSASWADWHESRPVLSARVITAAGHVFRLDAANVTEGGGGQIGAVMFSDHKSVSAPLPGVSVGAVIETETTVAEHRTPFVGGTWQLFGLPPGTGTLRITVESAPSVGALRAAPIDLPAGRIQQKPGLWTYEAEGVPVKAAAAPRRVPRLVLTTWASWAAVSASWSAVVEPLLRGSVAAPEALDPLIAGLPPAQPANLRAAVQAVAARIHERVRYTGIELGQAAYVPLAPAKTLERTYGDCKDLTLLAAAALSRLGYTVALILVRAQSGMDLEREAPGLAAFNHVLLRVGTNEPLWLDMTARHLEAGMLPAELSGLPGLVVAPKDGRLVTLPKLGSADHTLEIAQTITLGDLGAGVLEERLSGTGELAAEIRRLAAEPRALEQRLAEHAPGMFGTADFTIVEAPKSTGPARYAVRYKGARQTWTFDRIASAAASPQRLVEFLPPELTEREPAAPLRLDLPRQITLTTRILRPEGFVLPPAPKAEKAAFGGGTWRREARLEADALIVTWFVDTGAADWTAQQVEAARKSLKSWLDVPLIVTLRHEATALEDAGKVKEALAIYRGLADAHPGTTGHQVRHIEALVRHGHGAWGRMLAQRVLAAKPRDPNLHAAAGWAALHGDFGDAMGLGASLPEARAAFEAVLRQAPEHDGAQWGLALALVYGNDRTLHGEGADLPRAMALLRGLRERFDDDRFDTVLLGALAALGRHEEALALAGEMPDTEEVSVVLTYGLGLKDGPAALAFAQGRVRAESERASVLVEAARRLVQRRRYPAVKLLLTAAEKIPQGRDPAKQMLSWVNQLARRETVGLPAGDPTTPVRRLLMGFLAPETLEEALKHSATRELRRQMQPHIDELRAQTVGLVQSEAVLDSRNVLLDVVNTLPMVVEPGGSHWEGYAIRIGQDGKAPAPYEAFRPAMRAFVAQEDGSLRVMGFTDTPGLVGRAVIDSLGKKRLGTARRWLDWMAPTLDLWIEQDPFLVGGERIIWMRGDKAYNEQIAAAAWLALGDETDAADALATFGAHLEETARQQRVAAQSVLIRLLTRLGKTDQALALADAMLRQFPSSASLMLMKIDALTSANRWDKANALARWGLLQRGFEFGHSGFYLTLAAEADRRAATGEVEQFARSASKAPLAGRSALRLAIWASAANGHVDKTIDAWGEALLAQGNHSLGDLAALAAWLVARERRGDALRLLRRHEEAMGRPSSRLWYVTGRLLDADGEAEGADAMYRRAIDAAADEKGALVSAVGLATRAQAGARPVVLPTSRPSTGLVEPTWE